MENFQRQEIHEPNENGEEGAGSELPAEGSNSLLSQSLSEDSPQEELSQLLERLQLEVLQLANVDIPELLEEQPTATANITKILTKLCQKNKSDQGLPECSIEKALELIDKDTENCNLLIASLSEQIKKEQVLQKQIEQQREIVSKMIEDLEHIDNSPPQDISRKVNQMFKHFRGELRELVNLWAGDSVEECTDLLAELTSAYLNEPGSDGQYVDVTEYDRTIIQKLVSCRIAIWNKEGTHLKLHI